MVKIKLGACYKPIYRDNLFKILDNLTEYLKNIFKNQNIIINHYQYDITIRYIDCDGDEKSLISFDFYNGYINSILHFNDNLYEIPLVIDEKNFDFYNEEKCEYDIEKMSNKCLFMWFILPHIQQLNDYVKHTYKILYDINNKYKDIIGILNE